MASELDPDIPAIYVLARQALWAGDRAGAMFFLRLAEEQIPEKATRRMTNFASLEDIVAANVTSMIKALELLERRNAPKGDLARGTLNEFPIVVSPVLRGVVFGDGFGQSFLRAYLLATGLERQFRKAVDKAAKAGINVAGRNEEKDQVVDNDGVLADSSRNWIDADASPKVLVQVGEFTLVDARCSWCPPPDDGDAVRARFTDVLATIDPVLNGQ